MSGTAWGGSTEIGIMCCMFRVNAIVYDRADRRQTSVFQPDARYLSIDDLPLRTVLMYRSFLHYDLLLPSNNNNDNNIVSNNNNSTSNSSSSSSSSNSHSTSSSSSSNDSGSNDTCCSSIDQPPTAAPAAPPPPPPPPADAEALSALDAALAQDQQGPLVNLTGAPLPDSWYALLAHIGARSAIEILPSKAAVLCNIKKAWWTARHRQGHDDDEDDNAEINIQDMHKLYSKIPFDSKKKHPRKLSPMLESRFQTLISWVDAYYDWFLSTRSHFAANLTAEYRTALRDMMKAANEGKLIFRQADKVRRLIVDLADRYKIRCHRMIDQQIPVNNPPLDALKKECNNAVHALSSLFEIPERAYKALEDNHPKIGPFSGLHKIHKGKNCVDTDIRPLVDPSQGCLGTKLAWLVQELLAPSFENIQGTVDSTEELIRHMSNQQVGVGSYAYSMDVRSMYPSLPADCIRVAVDEAMRHESFSFPETTDDGISTALRRLNIVPPPEVRPAHHRRKIYIDGRYERCWEFTPAQRREMVKECVIAAAEICLKCCYFHFDRSTHRQTEGLVMGQIISSLISNLFMSWHDRQRRELPHMKKYNQWIVKELRYADDVNGLWRGSLQDLQNYFKDCNAIHPRIQFDVVFSQKEVPALDILICISPQGVSYTRFYEKPIATGECIKPWSAHAESVKRHTVIQEVVRRLRNCSRSPDDALESLNILRKRLRKDGWTNRWINRRIAQGRVAWQRVLDQEAAGTRDRYRSRVQRRAAGRRGKHAGRPGPPTAWIAGTCNEQLINTFRGYVSTLGLDNLLQIQPISGPNIVSLLSRNCFPGPLPCRKVTCHIRNSQSFDAPDAPWPRVRCCDADIVYCAICSGCGCYYFGETEVPFCERLTRHMTDRSSKIYQHVHSCRHCAESSQFAYFRVIEGRGFARRKIAEKHYIFNSHLPADKCLNSLGVYGHIL